MLSPLAPPPPHAASHAASASAASRPSRSGRGAITATRVLNRPTSREPKTVLTRLHAESPLRFVRPTFPNTISAGVCIVTFGGGLVDGDDIDVELVVDRGATLVVFTQSTTKVFRGSSRQTFRARVDGTLVFLPDPVAAFADAFYTQRVDVTLGPTGACVLMDGFTSGRPAFGERWRMSGLDLRTTILTSSANAADDVATTPTTPPTTKTKERVVMTDALRLDVVDGSIAERTGSFEAFATLVAVGQGALPIIDAIERDPIDPPNDDLLMAASPLPRARRSWEQRETLPGAILRVAASSPSRALATVRSRLRNLPEMDAVDPFASRY